MIKIGDKVRFLSETGGGRVAGFKGNNIVLVEDEDGFQIPTPISDVVVTGDGHEYNTSNMVKAKSANAPNTPLSGNSVKAKLNSFEEDTQEEEDEIEISDLAITFKQPVEERKGGNILNCFLAFVPVNIKDFSNTNFECFFVNDSNYYVQYIYLMAEGATWKLRSSGEVEPNTKTFIEEFGHDALNEFNRVAVQMIAYKRDKNFIIKPTIEVQFRIEPIKFYKYHAFSVNDYFENPALLYPIVENDRPARSLVIDPLKLKQEMYSSAPSGAEDSRGIKPESSHKATKRDSGKDNLLVVDLHADKLLDTVAGMGTADILNYQLSKFRQILEENKTKKGKRIIFIHGKGEGVLRHAIISELRYKYKSYTFQDASFQEYGYGATQVTIK